MIYRDSVVNTALEVLQIHSGYGLGVIASEEAANSVVDECEKVVIRKILQRLLTRGEDEYWDMVNKEVKETL